MTLTLELTPEQERQLQTEAERSGIPLSDYILRRLLGTPSQAPSNETARLAAIDAAFGALAGTGISSEDFMREKHEEIEREEQRWQERYEKGRT
jgi:hypothetical protein